MVEISQEINNIIGEYISDIQKYMKVEKAFVYGSYAKGNNNEYSDIDIAIFSDGFINQSFVESVSFLFSIARKYKDTSIEPVAFTLSDLQNDNPFVNEIIATGREIPVN